MAAGAVPHGILVPGDRGRHCSAAGGSRAASASAAAGRSAFDPRDRRRQWVPGAARLYLRVTGIVYAMLLSHICVGDEQGWVDDVLQRSMPMVMIVD
ncbi:hypothetical protein ACQPXH_19830 [Nocardia sp. CA-135953]|uniref:hypothetical protein n=1 Tax=Nocardia sp. CA-135953 TaxID=3239978 RepID=UPI003D95AADE